MMNAVSPLTATATSVTVLMWLFLVLPVGGHWIDPDTPSDAHYTYSHYDVDHLLSHRYKQQSPQAPQRGSTATSVSNSTPIDNYTPPNPPDPYSHKRRFSLVFSDEFDTAGRTFTDGQDSRWTSLDKNDYTNFALHYYADDAVKTSAAGDAWDAEVEPRSAKVNPDSNPKARGRGRGRGSVNGVLNISTVVHDKRFPSSDKGKGKSKNEHGGGSFVKHYRSGMLQSWNKFCFTGESCPLSVPVHVSHTSVCVAAAAVCLYWCRAGLGAMFVSASSVQCSLYHVTAATLSYLISHVAVAVHVMPCRWHRGDLRPTARLLQNSRPVAGLVADGKPSKSNLCRFI